MTGQDRIDAMKEKLQEYALIAEIISAIAVVAGLIFVGLHPVKCGRPLHDRRHGLLDVQGDEGFVCRGDQGVADQNCQRGGTHQQHDEPLSTPENAPVAL